MNKKLTISIFAILACSLGAFYMSLPLPELKSINKTEKSSEIVDRLGRHISYVKGQKQVKIKLSRVPIDLIQLILLAEDKRFFEHTGIDFKALGRSALASLRSAPGVYYGGSTLTQQLVRILYGYERSILGKALVLGHALKLDWNLPKRDILEAYLNIVPFSHQRIGIVSAAKFYFNKGLENLTLSEKAALAILIQSPSSLSSKKGTKRLNDKKNRLLKKFFAYHSFEKWQKDSFLSEEINFLKINKRNSAYLFKQFLLKQKLDKEHSIKTTLDLGLQKEVQKIVYENVQRLKKKGVTNGAALVIDNSDGSVLSYVGSYNFFDDKHGQIDAIQVPRQPGSTLKPFTYALALENGYNLGSILPDIPMSFSAGNGVYRPRNYSLKYHGPVLFRNALGNSLNIPALYLVDKLSVNSLYNYLKSFKLKFNEGSEHYGVGLTLGNAEISLWDLVQAYSVFTNEGKLKQLKILEKSDTHEFTTLMKKETTGLINHILADNYARELSFGLNNIFKANYPLAVKTGTSTLFRDNWAIGYNKRFTVGVWVGDMDQKEMHNVSGITGAGPILRNIFDELMSKTKSRAFEIASSYKKKNICMHSGKLAQSFCPHKKTEFFHENETIATCDSHYEVTVRTCYEKDDYKKIVMTKYTPKFLDWAKSMEQYEAKQQAAAFCPNPNLELEEDKILKKNDDDIKIFSPHNGSLFAIDPDIPRKLQTLPFKLTGEKGFRSVQWFVNGKLLEDDSHFELKKGRFEVKAKVILNSGKKIERRARFSVI